VMQKKYSTWIFVCVVVILPLSVYSFVNWYQKKFERLPILYETKDRVTSFALVNQEGKTVSDKNLEGKILVVDFFFTHCPSVCPRMTNNLKKIQDGFATDTTVLINSFSIDPERDSTKRLAQYAQKFNVTGKGWNFLTGSKQEIYLLARKGFYITATDGDGGADDFIHSDKFVLVDKKGRIRGFYEGIEPSAMPQLVKDIRKLETEPD
jgi:protein SCO1/2